MGGHLSTTLKKAGLENIGLQVVAPQVVDYMHSINDPNLMMVQDEINGSQQPLN